MAFCESRYGNLYLHSDVLILRVVDSQISHAVLVKPMQANELILLLSRGLMFAPRIPLVDMTLCWLISCFALLNSVRFSLTGLILSRYR